MDKIDLEKYLEKLESFERTLSRDEDVDDKFIEGVEEVLQSLSMDAMRHMGKDYTSPKNTQPELGVLTTLRCNIKKFDPTAIIPTYSKEGDAGMDLTITSIIDETPHDITYGFGIGFEVPKGFVGLVFPRSSIRKMDLLLTNSVGVIDSGYRGELQATFKVVKVANATLTDNEIKSKVIQAIDTYFSINNWDFGESFYYTELSAYIHQQLANTIASIVIVPQKAESVFGNLFQVKAESNELFLSTASVSDVVIVRNLTDTNLRISSNSTN